MDKGMSRYAEWLEGFIGEIVALQPDRIGVVALMPDGNALTGYYGDCTYQDKALMSHHLSTDAMMDTIMANAKSIVEAAADDGEDGVQE